MRGGLSPHSRSISRSIGTISPACSSRIARSARCFGGPRSATAPPAETSSAPRSRKSNTSAATGGIPPYTDCRVANEATMPVGLYRCSTARRPGVACSPAGRQFGVGQSMPLGADRGGRGSDPRPPCLPIFRGLWFDSDRVEDCLHLCRDLSRGALEVVVVTTTRDPSTSRIHTCQRLPGPLRVHGLTRPGNVVLGPHDVVRVRRQRRSTRLPE